MSAPETTQASEKDKPKTKNNIELEDMLAAEVNKKENKPDKEDASSEGT